METIKKEREEERKEGRKEGRKGEKKERKNIFVLKKKNEKWKNLV